MMSEEHDCTTIPPVDECALPAPCCGGESTHEQAGEGPFARFSTMIDNCYAYAREAKAQGRPVVGIMCEFAPRELIMAAGGVPVCLCGGSAKMVEPAECDLPVNLCPLIKSTYGYHLRKANPFLEMADLIVAETTCDGKRKMIELMADTRALYVLELPHKPDDAEARESWYRELCRLKEALERRFSVEITDEKLREAMRLMNRERRLRRGLAELMQAPAPPLSGRQLLQLKSSISGIPCDLAAYEQALATLRAQPPDPRMASRVRVLLTGVPIPQGAERVLEQIEALGGLVVCQENCTGVKPLLLETDVEHPDPLRALADTYLDLPCSVMSRNTRRFELLRQLIREYRPQCVIELIWHACLTYDIESYYVKRLVEEDCELPYLRLQTDYSPADAARLGVRIEALFETARAN